MRIALVAEGPTDYEVIQASLKAILPQPFVLTQLQPEATQPQMGAGWGGVLKWCDAASQRHTGSLDTDPLLGDVDLLIIHLDVDVAGSRYDQCGPTVEAMAVSKGWAALPCARPCPPVDDSVVPLKTTLKSWLGAAQAGQKTVLCLPAQSTGTWLAAATLPPGHSLLAGAQCNPDLEARLGQLAKSQKIKKTVRDYRAFASQVVDNWAAVKALCSQAHAFEQAVLAAI
ncbi:hypothetical protein [uncultured Sphaerotilus sp.]|uniref:hypothetical protein n=1 Tax=uncultured Sphaerotilus sp. TaxID=474984 RepID=UPI0030CA4E7E